jgi:Rrf2 family protein
MQINSKVRYGLRTMIEIAIENENGIYQKDISQRQDLPNKYLDHIIAGLKAENLIRKANDQRKGYVLTRPADEISIYDIYTAFQADLGLAPCQPDPENCERSHYCSAVNFWSGLNDHIREYFEQTSLAELAVKQLEVNSRAKSNFSER